MVYIHPPSELLRLHESSNRRAAMYLSRQTRGTPDFHNRYRVEITAVPGAQGSRLVGGAVVCFFVRFLRLPVSRSSSVISREENHHPWKEFSTADLANGMPPSIARRARSNHDLLRSTFTMMNAGRGRLLFDSEETSGKALSVQGCFSRLYSLMKYKS